MELREYLKGIPWLRAAAISARRAVFSKERIPTPGRSELLGRLRIIEIESIPHILELLEKAQAMPTFVKVGANDGMTGDPCGDLFLRSKKWKGLLIEPVDYCVTKLREIYSDQSRFTIEQSAIGQKAERRKFFFVAKEAKEHIPELPEWYDQLGSFNRAHIAKHFHVDIEEFIVEKDIDVCPLSAILKRCGFLAPMFLHIDVEGFDYEVLKSLNFRESRPEVILVEHKHLSASDLCSMLELLSGKGYQMFNTSVDLVALSPGTAKILETTPYLRATD